MNKPSRYIFPAVLALLFICFQAVLNPVKADLVYDSAGDITPAFTTSSGQVYSNLQFGPGGTIYVLAQSSDLTSSWIEEYSSTGTLLYTSAGLGPYFQTMAVDTDGKVYIAMQDDWATYGDTYHKLISLNSDLTPDASLHIDDGYPYAAVNRISLQGDYVYALMDGGYGVWQINKDFSGHTTVITQAALNSHIVDSIQSVDASSDGHLYFVVISGATGPIYKCDISSCAATLSDMGTPNSGYRWEMVNDAGYNNLYILDLNVNGSGHTGMDVYSTFGALLTTQDFSPYTDYNYNIAFYNNELYYMVNNLDGTYTLKAYFAYSDVTPTPTPSPSPSPSGTVTPAPGHFQVSDQLTRLQVSEASDHTITFGTSNGLTASGNTIVISMPQWALSGDDTDVQLSANGTVLNLAATPGIDTWGAIVATEAITFTAPTSGSGYIPAHSSIVVKYGIIAGGTHTGRNPNTTGSFPVSVTNNTPSGAESGVAEIPIVDSDQVNITGFINTFIDFDIDTGTAPFVECAYNGCLAYDSGPVAGNYTVDLGELSSTYVNKSQDQSVMHAGGPGVINSIYFDLITNAYNGAVVTVTSQYGYLRGPDLNTIASVVSGNDIGVNSGKYGYTLPVAGTGNGTVNRNSSCQDVSHYCAVATSPSTVFDTNSKPLDYGRLRMDLAAAAAYTNNPGAYQDTLTFIATATF